MGVFSQLQKKKLVFYKEVFAWRKSKIPYPHLLTVSEPKYDQFRTVSLMGDMIAQVSKAKLFAHQKTKAYSPERENFFNVINTGSAASKTAHSSSRMR